MMRSNEEIYDLYTAKYGVEDDPTSPPPPELLEMGWDQGESCEDEAILLGNIINEKEKNE